MTVKKSFGFGNSSKYSSATFNENNELIFGRNGLLEINEIKNDGLNVVLSDITFVQEGVLVQKLGTVVITFPPSLPAPFFLSATIPDTNPTDNIAWSFVRRPQDIGTNTVLLAEWDGQEWRPLSKMTFKGMLEHRLRAALAYDNVGFNQGFRFVPNPTFTEYIITPGLLTDKVGLLTEKVEETFFNAIDVDADWNRIDTVLYRKLKDTQNRIGQFLLRPGNTFSGATIDTLYETVIGTNADVKRFPKIINLEDNSFILLYLRGYGDNSELVGTKYAEDRQTELVAPTVLGAGVQEYDAILDSNGDVTIVTIQEGDIFRMKTDAALAITLASASIESLTNDSSKPVIKTDPNGNYYVMYIYQAGPTIFLPYLIKLNAGGAVSMTSKLLINSSSKYSSVDFDVNQDFALSVAYTNESSSIIEFQVLDELGIEVEPRITVSEDTGHNDVLLVGSTVKNAKVHFTENHELYLTWQQSKTLTEDGLVFYHKEYKDRFGFQAVMIDIDNASENVTDHAMTLDWNNHGFVLANLAGTLKFHKFVLSELVSRLASSVEVKTGQEDGFDIVYDRKGSLILSYADSSTGTSANGAPTATGLFGSASYGAEIVLINADEVGFPLTVLTALPKTPTFGDTIVVSSSTQGNDGTYVVLSQRDAIIDGASHRIYKLDTAAFTAEAATGVSSQFEDVDGTDLYFVKQTAAVSYDFSIIQSEKLNTDLIAVMVNKADDSFLPWYSEIFIPGDALTVRNETFLISAGAIDWDKDTAGGTLTWDQELLVSDPYRNELVIAAGSIAGFAEDQILYIEYPQVNYLSADGETLGANKLSVLETSQYTIGKSVFVGDADSPGIVTTVVSVSTGEVEVADSVSQFTTGRGAYIIPRTVTLQKETRNTGALRPSSLGSIDSNLFHLAIRKNDLVTFRAGALTLEHLETGNLGDGVPENILSGFLNANEGSSAPVYSSVEYITQSNHLPGAASELDAAVKVTSDAVVALNEITNQNKTVKLIGGGVWNWDFDNENLIFSADAYLQVAGLANVRNTIELAASPLNLANDGDVAYIEINRDTGVASNRPVTVAAIATLAGTTNDNLFIIARRVGDNVIIGTNSFKLTPADNFLELDGALAEIHRFFSQLQLREHPTNKKRVLITGADKTLLNGTVLGQQISSLLMKFDGGEIDVEAGKCYEDDGLTDLGLDFVFPAIPFDEYHNFSVSIIPSTVNLADNTINVQILVIPGDGSGASLATAKRAPFGSGLKLGQFYIQREANPLTSILPITQDQITQLGTGGGSGGTGDASTALGRLEDLLDESFYGFLEPNVFSKDQEDKIDNTDGGFSFASNTFDLDAGEFLESYDLLDVEYLESLTDLLIVQVALIYDPDNIDSAPVVEITPNGDLADLQAVTMGRLSDYNDTFTGELILDLSLLTTQLLDEYNVSNVDAIAELDDTSEIQGSQEFTTAAETEVYEEIEVYLNKVGSPLGFVVVNLHADNAGDAGAILGRVFVNVGDLIVGDNAVPVNIGRLLPTPSTKHHISVSTDPAYKASFTTGVDAVSLRVDNTAPTIADRRVYDGASWAAVAGSSMAYKLSGRVVDLRMKLTATDSSKLVAYGVYYGEEAQNTQRLKRRAQFVFDGTLDKATYNTGFQIPWDVDLDFVVAVDVFGGQTWEAPVLSLSGVNKIVFPADWFDGRGLVQLKVKQVDGGQFDSSPENANLLSENFAGSNDPAIDKSVPGRAQKTRMDVVGTLVEITVGEFGDIVIKEA